MKRRFVTLDVFTARRYAGNGLAVVLDAEGLAAPAMQAIAREFNQSETVFVLPPADQAHRALLRIFTPASELPFAGHPTVGTAVLLARLDGGAAPRDITVEERVGPVRCTVSPIDADRGHARFAIPRLPREDAPAASRAAIAKALGLAEAEIGFGGFQPARWTAGALFSFVPVSGLEAITRCRVDSNHLDAAFGASEEVGVFIYCRETVEPGHDFHARMFAPRQGVAEDPATGSAVAAFSGLLARSAGLADGNHSYRIEQGYEMGRPSLIELSLTMTGGSLAGAGIGGEAIVVGEGTIEA